MFKRVGSLGWILFLIAVAVARADEAPATAPTGFSAQGNVTAQALLGGMSIKLGADVAVMSRGQQLRVDVSRLNIPGSDATMGALIAQLLPQGAFTVVLDRTAGTTTLWSADKRKYYVMAASKVPAPALITSTGTGSIMETLQLARSLKDYTIADISVHLSGHSSVNGHPATILQYNVRSQKRGEVLSTMSGDVALADDEQGLPVRATSNLRGKNFNGSLRMEVRSLTTSAPDPSAFAVPNGFAQANDPSEIFGMPASH